MQWRPCTSQGVPDLKKIKKKKKYIYIYIYLICIRNTLIAKLGTPSVTKLGTP